MLVLYLCVTLIVTAVAHSDTLVVQVESGLVRGHREGNVYSFINVPYATAPTGPDRYKAPLPPSQWSELDAIDRGIFCPQPGYDDAPEDCLVVNIFIPDTNVTDLPVMVVIHGGAYILGAGQTQRYTDMVTTNDIIVVTFNYRLGVFGFLCLGTGDVPGNAGMKDQVALLRWVQRNIANFGGNPDDVTINGCSAGGASVDLLTLSPMAAGLFKKVISSSGAGLGALGAQIDPIENAKAFARALNFDNVDDINALEEFYKTTPINVFAKNFRLSLDPVNKILFTPCVEADHGDEKFLPDAPWNIITKGGYPTLPILYGFAELEGTVRVENFYALKEKMNENFADFLPEDLEFVREDEQQAAASLVKELYFSGLVGTDDGSLRNFLDYYSDTSFVYPILRTLNRRRESNDEPVYLYEYTYVASFTPHVLNSTTVRAAQHCEQELIVTDRDTSNFTPQDLAMRKLLIEMFINFAVTGVPSAAGLPAWPTVTGQWVPHMAIRSQPELQHTLPRDGHARVWEQLYTRYPKHPAPPSTGAAGDIRTPYVVVVSLIALSLLHRIMS